MSGQLNVAIDSANVYDIFIEDVLLTNFFSIVIILSISFWYKEIAVSVVIPTSDTVLWKGPSNLYVVHSLQHFFASHVTFGVTQWKSGVPFANTSNVN